MSGKKNLYYKSKYESKKLREKLYKEKL